MFYISTLKSRVKTLPPLCRVFFFCMFVLNERQLDTLEGCAAEMRKNQKRSGRHQDKKMKTSKNHVLGKRPERKGCLVIMFRRTNHNFMLLLDLDTIRS